MIPTKHKHGTDGQTLVGSRTVDFYCTEILLQYSVFGINCVAVFNIIVLFRSDLLHVVLDRMNNYVNLI